MLINNIRTLFIGRTVLLFSNFFLIITALYLLKPASRSLFISALGTEYLPYVWIATALVLGVVISFYHRMVARHTRLNVVLWTCAIIMACLLVFYRELQGDGFTRAFAFYMFVDMLSVILVEQFWSLTNTIYNTHGGRRVYGLIATGGLLGGVAGGSLSNILVSRLHLATMDLLLVAAATLLLLMLLNLAMGRLGLYRERGSAVAADGDNGHWRTILRHRYLLLIAFILLLAQVIEPLVEYQFMHVVEANIAGREARTAYLGGFFSVLSAVAITVNLLVTPLVHRWLGALGGLCVQPLAVLASCIWYMGHTTLNAGAFLKIADRGMSYSINRASKELLYVPIDPVLIFQAKAWIDMFGYRLFRVLGSVLILLLTQWIPWPLDTANLGWLVLTVCMLWLLALVRLGSEYRQVLARGEAAQATP